ncbi:NAD(P)/FAD-dependent oxidoreductase [Methylobacterium mesophilicum]|uniref:flavin monoamine oxidase family protein n=1 Tax=Methylobacterium mesophilicum TaxID=39956 RepID=UPI002F2C6549
MAGSLFARLDQRFGTRPPAAQRQKDLQNRIENFAHHFDIQTLKAGRARKTKLNVVVVGGGFAGLMAANKLALSFNVKVFEARDRLGGRVWTHLDEGGYRAVEAGGELIGYNHPTWIMLAKKFGLGFTVLTGEDAFTSLDLDSPLHLCGRLVARKEAEGIYNELGVLVNKLCVEASSIGDPYICWKAENAVDLDSVSLGEWLSKQDCSDLARGAMEVQFSNTNGAPTSSQSYLANLAAIRGGALHGKIDDYFTQSETLRCEQGNQSLAISLAREIERQGGEVRLSTPISSIDIGESKASITSAGGDIVEADYVVLAVPPSLWSSRDPTGIRISPEIPADYRMSMGRAVKYLSGVSTRFWFGRGLSPNATLDTAGLTWDGTDNQAQLGGRPLTLSLFAGGPAADRAIEIRRDSGDESVRVFYDAEMAKIYPDYAGNVVGGPKFICWPDDCWTKAGYSCPAPGEVTRIGPFLSRPYHGRLVFAGEHCCLPFFGYMEGALQSGLATADAIIKVEGLL